MEPTRRQQMVSSIFLVIVSVMVMVLLYSTLPENSQGRRGEHQSRVEAAPPQGKSMIATDRVVMMKGEDVTVKRTRLVYKGLLDGAICLDMFILDLDPQYPYPKQISKAAAQEGFRLGSGLYQLVTVNQKAITLKIIN